MVQVAALGVLHYDVEAVPVDKVTLVVDDVYVGQRGQERHLVGGVFTLNAGKSSSLDLLDHALVAVATPRGLVDRPECAAA